MSIVARESVTNNHAKPCTVLVSEVPEIFLGGLLMFVDTYMNSRVTIFSFSKGRERKSICGSLSP
jgi:hypothetical protein